MLTIVSILAVSVLFSAGFIAGCWWSTSRRPPSGVVEVDFDGPGVYRVELPPDRYTRSGVVVVRRVSCENPELEEARVWRENPHLFFPQVQAIVARRRAERAQA